MNEQPAIAVKGEYGFTFELKRNEREFTFRRYTDRDLFTATLHRVPIALYADIEAKQNAVARTLTTYAGANIKVINKAKSLIV